MADYYFLQMGGELKQGDKVLFYKAHKRHSVGLRAMEGKSGEVLQVDPNLGALVIFESSNWPKVINRWWIKERYLKRVDV